MNDTGILILVAIPLWEWMGLKSGKINVDTKKNYKELLKNKNL